MRNLIGDDVHGWGKILESPDTKLHLYGKSEASPGRKMGHMTRLYPKTVEWSPGEVETALKNWD
jgi:5-(carboxyamino)imidazole ribonucleotide synthase